RFRHAWLDDPAESKLAHLELSEKGFGPHTRTYRTSNRLGLPAALPRNLRKRGSCWSIRSRYPGCRKSPTDWASSACRDAPCRPSSNNTRLSGPNSRSAPHSPPPALATRHFLAMSPSAYRHELHTPTPPPWAGDSPRKDKVSFGSGTDHHTLTH